MKQTLILLGGIQITLGLFLMALCSLAQQSLKSLYDFCVQFLESAGWSFQISFRLPFLISLVLVAAGILLVVLGCRRPGP